MQTIGNTAFDEKRNPVFSAGGYELDVATWPWQGGIANCAAFQAGLSSFSALPGFSKMYLMRWPADDEPHFPTVTLEYTGCKSGSAPPVKIEDGLSLQSLTVAVESTTYSSGDTVTIAMDIEYYAQQSIYSWFALSTPGTTPTYAVARRVVDLKTTVFTRQYKITQTSNPTDTPTGKIDSVDTATYTKLNNALVQGHKLQEYKVVDLVPNALWQCSSVVNYAYTVTGV